MTGSQLDRSREIEIERRERVTNGRNKFPIWKIAFNLLACDLTVGLRYLLGIFSFSSWKQSERGCPFNCMHKRDRGRERILTMLKNMHGALLLFSWWNDAYGRNTLLIPFTRCLYKSFIFSISPGYSLCLSVLCLCVSVSVYASLWIENCSVFAWTSFCTMLDIIIVIVVFFFGFFLANS